MRILTIYFLVSMVAPNLLYAIEGDIYLSDGARIFMTGTSDFHGNISTSFIVGKIGDDKASISTGAVANGKFDDSRISITTGAIPNGTWTDGRVSLTTAAVSFGTFADNRVSITTGAIPNGTWTDARVSLTTAAVAFGAFSDNRVSITTGAIPNGTWTDARVIHTTGAITLGTFGDNRVSITTNAVTLGKFGDNRLSFSTGALSNGNWQPAQLPSTAAYTNKDNGFSATQTFYSSVTIFGSAFQVGGGTLTVTVGGHVENKGQIVSISACGTTPGTPTGNDMVGRVTSGTANPASCTVTFKNTWTNAPGCSCNDETRALSCSVNSVTTTSMVMKSTNVFSARDVLSWQCSGF